MKYVGSKARLSKQLAPIIQSYVDGMGGGLMLLCMETKTVDALSVEVGIVSRQAGVE